MATMTQTEARRVFDEVIAKSTDADQVAKVEMLREFFCNPGFRAAMADEVARINDAQPVWVIACGKPDGTTSGGFRIPRPTL